MKFILLTPELSRGGSERFISNLSLALSKEHQVTVCVFENKEDYPVGGRLVSLNLPSKKSKLSRILNVFARKRALTKLIKREKPDVVLSVRKAGNRVNTMLKAKNVRRFISCRGFADLESDPEAFLKGAQKTDGVIFNSIEARDYFCQHYGGPMDKAFYNYNLIDFESIERGKRQPLQEPALEAFLEKYRCIACMGRLTAVKGQKELIRAFEILSDRIPDSGLVFIGGNGDLKDEIMDMAAESPCKDRIFFTGDRDNPYNILIKCSVYAMPSKAEGFPNALVEAMACGLCPVSSDCRTGPNEILRGSIPEAAVTKPEAVDYGILAPLPEGKEEIFSQALEMALTDHALHDKLSSTAAVRAAEFSPDKALRVFLEIVSGEVSQ